VFVERGAEDGPNGKCYATPGYQPGKTVNSISICAVNK